VPRLLSTLLASIPLPQRSATCTVSTRYQRYLTLSSYSASARLLIANISLHGGSDTPGRYFVSAVEIGVTKININSDMRYAYRTTLEKVLKENPDEYSVAKLVSGEVVDAVQAVVESKLEMFNSSGKASTSMP
jgi:fructose-bisphosphate aldolase, class II